MVVVDVTTVVMVVGVTVPSIVIALATWPAVDIAITVLMVINILLPGEICIEDSGTLAPLCDKQTSHM